MCPTNNPAPSGRSGMIFWTLREVRDGSGDSRVGPGRVVGPSRRSRTGRRTLVEVRDRSRDPGGSGMIFWTLREVRDGSGDSRVDPGRVVGPSRRSRTGRGTLGEVLDGSLEPQEGSGRFVGPSERSGMGGGPSKKSSCSSLDSRERSRTGRGPSERSGTGQGTLGVVRDGS